MNAPDPLVDVLTQDAAAYGRRDALIASLYQGVTLKQSFAAIASAIADELPIDRASLLRRSGATWKLVATSTQPSVDSRARQVRLLQHLVAECVRDSRSLTFELGVAPHGQRSSTDASNGALDAYLDESGCREFHVETIDDTDDKRASTAFVLERFRYADVDENQPGIANLLRPFRPLLRGAVSNAVQRSELGLGALLGHWLARTWANDATRRRSAGALAALVAVAVLGSLFHVPLTIPVQGRVVASNYRHVFAPADGQIAEVLVRDGELVVADQPLVRIRSAELDRIEQTAHSNLATAEARLDSLLASRSRERTGLAEVEEQTLKSEIEGFQSQLEIGRAQQSEMTVRSPIDGRIDRWDVSQTLDSRPVTRGQFLLDVVSIDDGYDVLLEIPDRHMGDVLAAAAADDQSQLGLTCTLRLLSNPEYSFAGVVEQMDDTAHQTIAGDSVFTARVPLDAYHDGSLRGGATVIANLECGRASAAYVWFRGVVHWWRGQTW